MPAGFDDFPRWVGCNDTRCHLGGALWPPPLSVCWRSCRCTERGGSVRRGRVASLKWAPLCRQAGVFRAVGRRVCLVPGSRQERSWHVVVALPSRAAGTPQWTSSRVKLCLKWGSVWWQSHKLLVGRIDFLVACGPLQNLGLFNLTSLLIVYIGRATEASPLGQLRVLALLYVRLRSTYGYIRLQTTFRSELRGKRREIMEIRWGCFSFFFLFIEIKNRRAGKRKGGSWGTKVELFFSF